MEDLILPPESDTGNIEYKLLLSFIDKNSNLSNNSINNILEKRLTQMKYRLNEGNGEAIYYIGVMDNGTIMGIIEDDYNLSVNNIKILADKINCTVIEIYKKELLHQNKFNDLQSQKKLFYGQLIIREIPNNMNIIDLKIGVVGNVDSGKSTLVGCLTKDVLDDGRGKSRLLVFNYPHEVKTGRTSSIGHQIMGFDKDGNYIRPKKLNIRSRWLDITKNASKVVSFYDMAGHEKYLRTTIYGLASMHPDYCVVVVGGNMGFNHMTREHIALCVSLHIPIIIVVTKIDIAPLGILDETMNRIKRVCKNAIRKIPYEVKTYEDVINIFHNIKTNSIVPVFKISNVDGKNLDLLKTTFNLLPTRKDYSDLINLPIEMLIDSKYFITGHGTVVSGLLKQGTVHINDNVYIGPIDNNYIQSKIKSIHVKHSDVKEAKAGTYICLCLRNINKKIIHKGMVLIGENQNKLVVSEFWASITILHSHHTSIKKGYQPYLHIEQVRQCAKILEIKDFEVLRTGDVAQVKLQFLRKPEYIKPGMNLIFRDGKVKAVGKVYQIL